jgi:hypothetical protein
MVTVPPPAVSAESDTAYRVSLSKVMHCSPPFGALSFYPDENTVLY